MSGKTTLVCCVTAIAVMAFAAHAHADPPTDPVKSFSTAKKMARNIIYEDHQTTSCLSVTFILR